MRCPRGYRSIVLRAAPAPARTAPTPLPALAAGAHASLQLHAEPVRPNPERGHRQAQILGQLTADLRQLAVPVIPQHGAAVVGIETLEARLEAGEELRIARGGRRQVGRVPRLDLRTAARLVEDHPRHAADVGAERTFGNRGAFL